MFGHSEMSCRSVPADGKVETVATPNHNAQVVSGRCSRKLSSPASIRPTRASVDVFVVPGTDACGNPQCAVNSTATNTLLGKHGFEMKIGRLIFNKVIITIYPVSRFEFTHKSSLEIGQ